MIELKIGIETAKVQTLLSSEKAYCVLAMLRDRGGNPRGVEKLYVPKSIVDESGAVPAWFIAKKQAEFRVDRGLHIERFI